MNYYIFWYTSKTKCKIQHDESCICQILHCSSFYWFLLFYWPNIICVSWWNTLILAVNTTTTTLSQFQAKEHLHAISRWAINRRYISGVMNQCRMESFLAYTNTGRPGVFLLLCLQILEACHETRHGMAQTNQKPHKANALYFYCHVCRRPIVTFYGELLYFRWLMKQEVLIFSNYSRVKPF